MTATEMNRIERSIDINAAPERVWHALTTAAELSAWFHVTIEGDIAPGNEVWMTSTHPGYEGVRFRVLVVEMVAPSRFVWQWHPGAVDPNVDYSQEPRTTVTFTLERSESGTRLTVCETGFDQVSLARRAKVFADNSQGWTTVVVWIKQHVEAAR